MDCGEPIQRVIFLEKSSNFLLIMPYFPAYFLRMSIYGILYFMETQSKVLRWSLIIGIVIVLNLFFNYSLSLIYKEPQYQAFCPNAQVIISPKTPNECTSKGGQWTENGYYAKPAPAPTDPNQPAGYCDINYTCSQNYLSAQKTYDRNVFITLVILGALSVAAGSFFKGNTLLGNALSMAGVFSFIIASIRYWGSADNLIKVVILAIALAILVWVAVKKFK